VIVVPSCLMASLVLRARFGILILRLCCEGGLQSRPLLAFVRSLAMKRDLVHEVIAGPFCLMASLVLRA